MTKHCPIDVAAFLDAIREARTTNSMRALAELAPNHEETEWLREQKLGKPMTVRKIAQARASLVLMRDELKETRSAILRASIATLHFDGRVYGSAIDGVFDAELRGAGSEARAILDWIRSSPQRKAKQLARLQAAIDAAAAAVNPKPTYKSLRVGADQNGG